MKKQVINKFGKKWLLGIKDGEKVWLCEPTFDCNWYYSIGYVQTLSNRDVSSHAHFDYLFYHKNLPVFDMFKDYFDTCVLDDKEIWILLELMQTLYTIRNYSDCIHRGGSNYTKVSDEVKDTIKRKSEYDRINTIVIPRLIHELDILLRP